MWEDMLILSIAGFLAAATDAIAGGGGLISLPALLLAGAPPHLALGTNKFASTTTGAGTTHLVNTAGLTVDSVAGVDGVSRNDGDITLIANAGDLTIAD